MTVRQSMAWVDQLPGSLKRFINLGAEEGDPEELRVHKATLTIVAALTIVLSFIWVGTYLALGLVRSAAIPFAYQVVSAVSLAILARNKRFSWFRLSQVTMFLLLPFLLQWSLGGFANGSAVAIWAVATPIVAYLVGLAVWPWHAGFVALVVTSGLIDSSLAESAPDIPEALITVFFVLNFLGPAFVMLLALVYFVRERENARAALAEQHRRLEIEQAKSERLLLNILPAPIAERLKEGESVIADRVAEVTVLFADLVDFTPMTERMEPDELVDVLNGIFTPFDELADSLGLEKIKTVGDAYMVVGGLPVARPDHAEAVAEMALAMRAEVADRFVHGHGRLEMRIGIDSGPVVAGVIGKKKFSYGLWGDTVNTASRMESHGVPGRIQVTDRVFARLDGAYRFDPRGAFDVKGKGKMATYFLEGRIASEVPSSVGGVRASQRRAESPPPLPDPQA